MDVKVVQKLQEGDAKALQIVHHEYADRLRAYAMKIVRDQWDAEEVVQDALWTAFRKASTLERPETFEAWLFRITRNSGLMLLRKRKRLPIPTEDIFIHCEQADDNPYEPDQMLIRREALEQAQAAFDALNDDNQRVFYAMDVEGRDKEDVADEMLISVAAVKARLHRARAAIRDAFGESLSAA